MNLKVGWIRLKGAADFVGSSFLSIFKISNILPTFVASFIASLYATGIYINVKEEPYNDHTDHMEADVSQYRDGHILRVIDNCTAKDRYYLLSKRADDSYEISVKRGDAAQIIPHDQQEEIVKDISECMDTLAEWAKDDNYNFADEFYYASGIEYAEPVYITDTNDSYTGLYKDLLDIDDIDNLEDVVEDHDDYDSDQDNLSLYKQEFEKAQQTWSRFEKDFAKRDLYFNNDGEVKNPDKYPQHSFESASATDVLKVWGTSVLITALICGAITLTNNASYHSRAARRRSDAAKAKQIQGLDNTKF